jgi:DNA-binding FadR family transcriptional regulator
MTTSSSGELTPVDRFGQWIASGMHQDAVLSLAQVAHDYGLTRARAREMCQLLQAKGMLDLRQKVGVTIQPMDRWQLYDERVMTWRLEVDYASQLKSLTELRLAVEPHAAGLAAHSATPQQRSRLRGLARELLELGTQRNGKTFDRAAYLSVDQRYHQLQLQSSGNEMFQALTPAIDRVLQARIEHAAEDDQPPHPPATPQRGKRFPQWPEKVALLLHVATAEAIYLGRGDIAANCARAILLEVSGRIEPHLAAEVKTQLRSIPLPPDLDPTTLDTDRPPPSPRDTT